ncbi:MAG TPA: hypothetical protein DHD79_08945 [Firmicutes bacterium]|nr:hypothetical protein [Bacillota bacterium]HAW70842.1 hypothetical protein [Bacillota bacterium]HAZ22070.1 hypothetical protein [Bacillota bacterium]HBG44337.1 hypothetical protein [Bacillota bacterium]HBL49330.1 hypothetical protein [Bacillota bacterium]
MKKNKLWRSLFLVAILIVVCAVALTGCGKKDDETDAQDNATAVTVNENMLTKTADDLGVNIYAGATQVFGEEADGVLKVIYTTSDAYSMVNAYYEMRYPSAMRTETTADDGSAAIMLTLMDEKNTTMTIVDKDPVQVIIEQPQL